ncbi:MAG: helical backbone metal receptor [Gemmatimonadota bacterium]|nr:helical backbone metal receptor [Gemmatimonadota bacterium]
MKRNYLVLLFIVILSLTGYISSKKLITERESLDSSLGRGRYSRIISLTPGVTETLFALGLGDRVVGVSRFCNYPPEAREKKRVGGYLDPNYEAMAVLKPDLVIVLPEQEKVREYLDELDIEYLVVHNRKVEEIIDAITVIGTACGAVEQAHELVDRIESRINKIRRLTESSARPRVLIVIGRAMSTGSVNDIYIAGKDTSYDELITYAGGRNAFENKGVAYPMLTAEGILHLDPDVIIELVPELGNERLDTGTILKEWESVPGVRAVKNKRVSVIKRDYTVIPGPRFIVLLEDLARLIHPETDWSEP